VKRVIVIRALLDEAVISSRLSSKYWRVRVLAEVASTQEILKTELVSNGDCVATEFQSAGRGRLDRKFESAPHVALLFSFYIEPRRKSEWGQVPLIVGTSVARVINAMVQNTSYQTKWPNDVIAESGKICGILCERFGNGIIVGIGINVSTTVDELPVDTASSIFIESGVELDRNELLPRILCEFEDLYSKWNHGENLISSYRALSSTIGREVIVHLPDQRSISGVAIGIDIEGQLLLESGDVISAGDVIHLR
jgi:BirA family biotin operon repressor/biotin-[acetyl-CoA-carboxylase] ligase